MKRKLYGLRLTLAVLFCLCAVPAISIAGALPTSMLSSLEQLEPFLTDGPEVQAALAAVARDEALEASVRQSSGAKGFGSVTYGYSNEPQFDTSEDKRRYNKITLTGGLSFPLLGTLQKERVGQLEAATTALAASNRSQALRLDNLTAVRKAYVALWIEQQKAAVAERFLQTEAETSRILLERQTLGLLLPADRLTFLSVYQDIRRDMAAAKLRQTRALRIICLATGREWTPSERLQTPSLPNLQGQTIDLDNHPEILFQQKLIAQNEQLLTEKQRFHREANLTVGLTAARDYPGTTGNGAYIALSVAEPFNAVGKKDQMKQAAADDLNRVRQEAAAVRLKLAGRADEAIATAAYAAADVNAYTARLIAMTESIRERMLRHLVLPGDTFEQLQQSKAQYYQSALALLDREELFLDSAIDIASLVYPQGLGFEAAERIYLIREDDPTRERLLGPSWLGTRLADGSLNEPLDFSGLPNLQIALAPARTAVPVAAGPAENQALGLAVPVKAAVYVWQAEPFLQADTRAAQLQAVTDAGFSRLLISLTAKQFAVLETPQGKAALTTLLSDAKSKGLRTDLLLGDPLWATSEHRGQLLELVRKVKGFAFEGIHLDIEPDSLPGAAARREQLLAGLAETVAAVQHNTTLPVAISIHPRYLEGELGVLAGQKLLPLNLEEVVVMMYSSDPTATADRMAAIIAAHPGMALSLAQSVEKGLPMTQSYAASPRQEFRAAMRTLASIDGLHAIYIQAWEDYGRRRVQ